MAKQCIGIDIGHHAIKLVQLKIGRRGEHSLQNFGIEPLPEVVGEGLDLEGRVLQQGMQEIRRHARIHIPISRVVLQPGENEIRHAVSLLPATPRPKDWRR